MDCNVLYVYVTDQIHTLFISDDNFCIYCKLALPGENIRSHSSSYNLIACQSLSL